MGALQVRVEPDHRLAHRAKDVRRREGRGLFLASLRLELGGNGSQVEGGCPAVEADVAGLRHAMVLVLTGGIDLDLGEQLAKQIAAAAA